MTNETKIPRVGLIGVSGYGRVYLQLALEHQRRGDLRLAAVVVINPEEEEVAVAELRQLDCEIFSDFQSMLERFRGQLDLCLIPTGIGWHTRMTLAALAAGANVLVEKPLASSVAEVSSIEAAAKRADRFVAVGFQDFYEPATAWLKDRLLSGSIGTVQSVRFLGQWPRARSYFTRNDWAGRLVVDGVPVLDSPLNNAFAHFVNLSLFFASKHVDGDVEVRIESAELFRAHEIENFDTAVVRLRTMEGVGLWFGVTHSCQTTREPEIVVQGDAGSVIWRHEADVQIFTESAQPQIRKLGDGRSARHAMMATVLQRLRDPSVLICGPIIAGRHTALIEQIGSEETVLTVPPDLIEWSSANGPADGVPVVAGLEEALVLSYASGQTLASAGFQLGDDVVPVTKPKPRG
jgi:predicted dehydrogenase